ncbi:MAG TPA: methyltransferase domain-containing protein [Candidatus Nanoarchaeia archaeon]|nr:methyltransferase domain-containing protein [Candidatus Nanoarchaeia archaeon]
MDILFAAVVALCIALIIYILISRDEELLEPVFRKWRTDKVLMNLPKDRGEIVDVGCGNLSFLRKVDFRKRIGIDSDVPLVYDMDALEGLRKVGSSSAQCVTFIASLEHFEAEKAKILLREAYKALSKGGKLIITIPSPSSEWILDFLCALRLVSKEMIEQHHYHSKEQLHSFLSRAGFSKNKISVKKFELGLNTLIVCEK